MRERRVIFSLWLLLMALGIIFAFIQPVWSRVDEAQHYDYVQYVAENLSLPVEGKDFISQDVVDVSVKSNQWGWRPAGVLSTPADLDPALWTTLPGDLGGLDKERWVRRNLWYFGYEAMQPPLYYMVNAPVYAALPDDPFVKLYGMRLLAALLASAMVPITWLTAREASPGNRLAIYGAPVAMLLTQGYALNMSQITNDALAVPLAATAVLILLRLVVRGLAWKRSLAAGTLIGAALLTKMTTIFLLPAAAAALIFLLIYKRGKLGRVALHAGIIYGVAAAIMAPWLAHNFSLYGDATGASAARPLMSSFFESPLLNFSTLRLDELLPTFWFGEPIFPFPFWTYAWMAAGTAIAVALIGVLYYYFGPGGWLNGMAAGIEAGSSGAGGEASGEKFPGGGGQSELPDARMSINFIVTAFAIGALVIILIPFGSGIGGVPGRYLYPLLPMGTFLLMFGIDRLLWRERARFMAEALLLWMVVWESLNFLAYIRNL